MIKRGGCQLSATPFSPARDEAMMRKTFKWLAKVYWKEHLMWSLGYFVGSVGLDEKMIKNYVEHQGR